MSFISYAQNFEDVMLWRALKHVEKGFYIDIGAQDPLIDSVSLAFYEHGWRGVHVEPTQQYSDRLRLARPDETVMQVAIGSQAGTLTFYEFEDTGLSTADVGIAHRHQDAGFRCNQTLVSVIPLDTLFERTGVQNVHWLKLDVEGLEKAVLASWKNSSVLPWVLVIESTRPLTEEQNHAEWEQLLLAKGYQYVYFDGLNRFYISPEHLNLAAAFNAPPNIFDGFVLSGSASQPFYKLVENKAQQSEAKAQQAETKAQQAEAKAQQAEAMLAAVYASSSWRFTAPMRYIKEFFLQISSFPQKIKSFFKNKLKLLLRHGLLYVNRRPELRQFLIVVLAKVPALRERLKGLLLRLNAAAQHAPVVIPVELSHLTPRARRIFMNLKRDGDYKNKEEY